MKKSVLFAALAPLALGLGLSTAQAAQAPAGGGGGGGQAAMASWNMPTPKRFNRVIELWQQNQPVYYSTITAGAGYEEGVRMAATKADYITYEMEHGAFDIPKLREFMKGLVDAGPTRTGHRLPPVIVTLPILGDSPEGMRANVWVAQQVLAAGVQGILLCQAENVEAVRIFVEAVRYPFHKGTDPKATHRGSGSQGYASQVWGMSQNEYFRRADLWPLNPEGEIIIGLKLENPKAIANSEALTKIPGIAFVEWGPGDQGFYLLGMPQEGAGDRANAPPMAAARARALAAAKAANVKFLNSCGTNDVINQLKEGVMICTGGDSPAADIGRKFTNRTTPW